MKWLLSFLCVLSVFLLTCSKKSTNSDDNNKPPTRTPFSISYTADPSRAASMRIVAATGGSITVRDKDSVSFELTIPAHALNSDATIEIIPLSAVSIGGPDGNACTGCPGTDSSCCHRGALFEPSGLKLDSVATLTVRFPTGVDLPSLHGGAVIFIDSATGQFQPCVTTCDTTARWLKAEITHFSGFGTDDPSYDEHEEAIYQTLDQAAEHIENQIGFFTAMEQLKVEYFWCSGHGDPSAPVYSDLLKVIETQSYALCVRHVNMMRDRASAQNSCDAMYTLDPLWENIQHFAAGFGVTYANAAEFVVLSLAVKGDVVTYFNETAQKGHRLCLIDSCEAGQDQLSCALAHQKAVDDRSLVDTVGNWALACNQCGIDVSVLADKDIVHKIAISPGDAENCIVRYSASVHNNVTEEPVQGASIEFLELTGPVGTRDLGSGTTDGDGRCEIIVPGSDFDAECGANLVQRVCALAIYNSKQYWSDTVSVAVRPLKIAVTVDFSATHHLSSEDFPGYLEEAAGGIHGTITGPGDWVWVPKTQTRDRNMTAKASTRDSSCWEGGFSMNWTMEFADPRVPTTSTGRLLNPKSALREVAAYATDTTVMVPGTAISVRLVTRIWTHLDFLRMPYAIEQSGVFSGRSYCDTTSYYIFGGGSGGWYCFGLATPQYPFPVVNGTCEPFRHSVDTLGTQSTTTITVAPVF